MKRFLLFAGDVYYASGGWLDFAGSFDTRDEAVTAGQQTEQKHTSRWWHVIDAQSGRLVVDGSEREENRQISIGPHIGSVSVPDYTLDEAFAQALNEARRQESAEFDKLRLLRVELVRTGVAVADEPGRRASNYAVFTATFERRKT